MREHKFLDIRRRTWSLALLVVGVVVEVEEVVAVGVVVPPVGRWSVQVSVVCNKIDHMMASIPYRHMELDSLPLGITFVDPVQLLMNKGGCNEKSFGQTRTKNHFSSID